MATRAAPQGAATDLRRLAPLDGRSRLDELLERPYRYRGWEDLYRDAWSWDRVVKVSHLRVNCISACSFDAYVKDGVVWREEQNANYAQTVESVPDFNPRGCPAGCAYSVQMYDPTRIRYPMKRVGPRGSGKWERLSWDQALGEIADRIIDVIVEDGPECVVYDHGTTNIDNGIGSLLEMHLFSNALAASTIDSWAGVGDLPVGLIQTWGTYMSEGTSDDWFLSDYILIWLGNPSYTRPSDAHFIWEARYRGAKVVTVSPDFSASTVHADRWLNVRVGTDAALALGLAHVLVDEGLIDSDFIREQTDLPFLIRDDDGRFLRESDVVEGGSTERFYYWDVVTNRKRLAPGSWGAEQRTIALPEGTLPALRGAHTVTLVDGSRVKVRPVFELLRRHLADYPPERVGEITGVHPDNVRQVARELAAARSAMIYASWGACKHYHSDLFQRGMAYLMALTGNTGGKPGSGLKVSSWWPMPGFVLPGEGASLRTEPPPEMPIDSIDMTQAQKLMAEMSKMSRSTPLIPWLYAHDPEWRKVASRDDYADPSLPRSVADYMDEIISRGWQPIWPRPPKRPRFFYYSGPNPLRRWPNGSTIRDSLWASIDTIVTCDFRLSTSGMWSDYVLPSAGYYEKPGIKYAQSYLPYVVVGDRAVPPLYESKHEWDVALLLARKIQERAKERGVSTFVDSNGFERSLTDLYDEMSGGGVYTPDADGEQAALNYILRHAPVTRKSDLGDEEPWREAAEAGMVRIRHVPSVHLAMGLNSLMSDFDDSRPQNQFDWFVSDKMPWPTLTGRQQFYLDHDWFLEVGEQFCTHKEPTMAGGPYPLRLTGGHTRWSQHSIFRANQVLLRLQRGQPVAYLGVSDARSRGIDDGDWVRVYNDVGEFRVRAKVSPSVQPGEIICYHAWEGYQFPGGATQNAVTASPLKPNNMVGGYAHLHYRSAYMSMNHVPKEVAVEVEKSREPV